MVRQDLGRRKRASWHETAWTEQDRLQQNCLTLLHKPLTLSGFCCSGTSATPPPTSDSSILRKLGEITGRSSDVAACFVDFGPRGWKDKIMDEER